ncbi:MAG TPA: sulfatase-like hydrolase/transferase [Terriglobia bacterium]|nr:sulfatase-like hydrolase/transferase [Terriglobia bacterium]
MKRFAWVFLPVLLSYFVAPACLGGASARPAEGDTRADVFLVTIDTLRADHVACYGDRNIRTPALDSLAADGIRFASAFTASPITSPSHASILTGLLPVHDGVRDFGMALAPGASTLAEVLKENGYATAAFIGSVVLDSRGLAPGFDRGFDSYDHFPDNLPPTASRYERLERRAMDVERRAETWTLDHGNQQPAFVWIHFYDPHDPYDPPEPYHTEYAGRLYDGEIAYADSALGRFVSFLKKQNLYDASTIIVSGDHGEGLGQHGEQTHGIFLYDSTLHVPLILKLPRRASTEAPGAVPPRGIVVTAQARTVDIAPTILDLEGIHDPEPRDGASLRPLWTAPDHAAALSPRVAFAETDYPLDFGWAPLRSVRAGEKKYIEAPRPEFYELNTDPGETRDLYEPWNPDVQRLRALEADVRKAAPQRGGVAKLGRAKIEELRALGYLPTNPGVTTAPEPSLLPDPKDEIRVFNLIHSSMVAAEDRNAQQARSDLESALRLDPKSAVVLAELGELELGQGDYRQAADLFGRAVAIQPRNAAAVYGQARALYGAGDLPAARARLESGESLLAGNYDAIYLLGKIDAELKAWRRAEDPLQAAIILDSSRPEAYVELARVYLAEEKPAEALRQLDQARRLAPESGEILRLTEQARQATKRRQ